MTKRTRAAALLVPLTIVALLSAVNARQSYNKRYHPQNNKAGVFDYYSLVLSWSPTFCDSRQGKRSKQQCGRKRRYAFVVHGLWPQHEKGWPQNCRINRKDMWIPKNILNGMTDIMPSKRLIIHEWKKHGTCSGLNSADYYALARTLFKKIKIPARYLNPKNAIFTTPQQIEKDFTSTNRWLRPDMVSVKCGRRKRLRELRFCFTKDGEPRNCGRNERGDCRTDQLVLPPVR